MIMAKLEIYLLLFCLILFISNSCKILKFAQGQDGQARWCVTKPSSPDKILQASIDYACPILTNCYLIRPSGACFLPDELTNHASVVMNLYYQKVGRNFFNCDFNNTGVITITDPSYGGCVYPVTV